MGQRKKRSRLVIIKNIRLKILVAAKL